ncbi:MAG TPA: TonB-dependent receptor [Steroidobacteraceae bacterium]|jgi:outer membrane receptor protein involved in Fe transport|nr:TonB-dependent receptor [Steroidobacteraceae bacterium]
MSNNTIRRAVRCALVTSAAAAAAGPAFAADQTIQEVVVTGSRIAQPNLETTSPVTQVTADDIAVQGVTRVEDLVNQLPQAFAAQNASVSNGSTGTATVNLRGLGSPRTLVLIDGRRMPYGGVTNSAADLNQIPAAMVERVEVLTGGASAAYGSDAIGGVVNFIMKKDFEGVQVDAMYGLYQHNNDYGGPGAVKLRDVIAGRSATNPTQFQLPDDNVTDGEARELNITMGVSTEDGRGNITAYAGVRDNKAVLQRDRDYSACSLDSNPTVSFACGGSDTGFPGYFYGGGQALTIDSTTGNTFRPYSASADRYNFGPANYFQRPDTRYTLGAMGHYELAEVADVYTQLMFADYESVAQIAPGGNFFNTNTINCDNPLLSGQQLTTVGCDTAADPDAVTPGNQAIVPLYMARRNVEGGGRQQAFENTSFRALLGVRGEISENWDYDASVQYSAVVADQSALNYFHKARIARALDVVTDPATGTPTCRSVLNGIDPNCVPYNPFTLGGVTPAALAYVQVPGLQQGKIEQEIYSATVTGDLGAYGVKSPWATESIKVAFGAENRYDRLKNVTDDPTSQDLLSGTGGPTIGLSGSTKVLDLFTELRVPLVQDRAFADQLGLELAYRYSDYDPVTTDTYKIGADWAPVQDVRFRASYQRAVRAPNVVELFTSQGFNLFDLPGDPCGTDLIGTAGEASRDACIASGVPAAVLDDPTRRARLDSPAGQYNFLQGGALDLKPETSDTYTYGVIIQPRFVPHLAMSIDYFDIKIEDTISVVGADTSLNACYFANDAGSCSRIIRNPGNGSLWQGTGHVRDLNTNIGSLTTKGVDMSVSYTGVELGGLGELSFNLVGTYLDQLTYVSGINGIAPTECQNKFSGALCGIPNPDWRHHFRIGWESPWNVDLSLTWRYYSAVTNIADSTKPNIDYGLGVRSFVDLAANWAVTEKASVLLGINNVLDKDPPLSSAVGTTGNGNTYPQTYDALGRWIFMRGQIAF